MSTGNSIGTARTPLNSTTSVRPVCLSSHVHLQPFVAQQRPRLFPDSTTLLQALYEIALGTIVTATGPIDSHSSSVDVEAESALRPDY